MTYEPCQVFAKDKYIVPDFGLKRRVDLFIEFIGRNDDAYWKYKIPRWKNVLTNCNAKFILVAYDLEKTQREFNNNISNVIGIIKFGQWIELKDLLSHHA